MSGPKRIQIKSRKQHIRLWFEFYKICLTQNEFKENLVQSHNFYKPWGNVLDIKFDDWWDKNKDLFGPTRVEEISKISKHPNSLNLVIPLNQKLTTNLKSVKTIIETKQGLTTEYESIMDSKARNKNYITDRNLVLSNRKQLFTTLQHHNELEATIKESGITTDFTSAIELPDDDLNNWDDPV